MSGEPPKLVSVPDESFRMSVDATVLWNKTGTLFEVACQHMAVDLAASVMLSRVTRELRRHYGVDNATTALRQLAETMAEVSRYDVD